MSGIAVCIPASTACLQRVLFSPGLLDSVRSSMVSACRLPTTSTVEAPSSPRVRDDVDGSAFSAGTFLIVEERDYIGHELG